MVKEHILIGAQNVSRTGAGAFTGEVAAEHYQDYGIQWVLVGHNERRNLFKEDQEIVMDKVK